MPSDTTTQKKPRSKQWRAERAAAIAAGRVRNQERADARREGGGAVVVQPNWSAERAAAVEAIKWLKHPVPLSEANSTPVLGFTDELPAELAEQLLRESEPA